MPKEIYKILGQERPLASTETVLYSPPVKRSSIGKVTVFNNGAGAALIKVAIVPDGAGVSAPVTAAKNYLIENFSLGAKMPFTNDILKGITLAEYDEIRVESDNADTIFQSYGVELEP